MATHVTSRPGTCPVCGAAVSVHDVLIEYESDGGPAAYAECPDCREVVNLQ